MAPVEAFVRAPPCPPRGLVQDFAEVSTRGERHPLAELRGPLAALRALRELPHRRRRAQEPVRLRQLRFPLLAPTPSLSSIHQWHARQVQSQRREGSLPGPPGCVGVLLPALVASVSSHGSRCVAVRERPHSQRSSIRVAFAYACGSANTPPTPRPARVFYGNTRPVA